VTSLFGIAHASKLIIGFALTMYSSAQMLLHPVFMVAIPRIPAETTNMTDNQSTMAKEFHNILKDVDSLLKEASTLGGDEFSQIREKIHARLATAKEELAAVSSKVAESVSESTTEATGAIRDEPWKAVGSAAAVGLLIGYIFARR